MKKQHDIIILDNALPKSLADEVENTTINPHFPYFYTFDIDKEEEVSTNTRVFYDKNTKDYLGVLINGVCLTLFIRLVLKKL